MSDEPSSETDSDPLRLVQDQIAQHIKAFSSAKRFFRRMSLLQTVSTATLGAATTFLIGLAQIYKHAWLSALSLAFSALATVSAAWTGWYSARETWVTYQGALNRLYALRSRIAFESTQPDAATGVERASAYYTECQSILDDVNGQWQQNRMSQS
ncbi:MULTISPECIES: SLATT domain-containing protein [unclassified Streptomyces]|uniref:SLATT domain-containing protein n=1 Tax=unclassified Streptomyces TaxID=2593676 RepID=UPI002E8222A9|nr:SLATT domain-containing protein [Streptomyces sp. NBC_00589]WTI33651.1 SLATT domain-containing protein [Streptomyces sp. NBC_00775]WUB32677.1 SLATT domain-containing protein [Streptomyces sp. NBC_00589]